MHTNSELNSVFIFNQLEEHFRNHPVGLFALCVCFRLSVWYNRLVLGVFTPSHFLFDCDHS